MKEIKNKEEALESIDKIRNFLSMKISPNTDNEVYREHRAVVSLNDVMDYIIEYAKE